MLILLGLLLSLCTVLATGAPLSSSFYGDTGCGVPAWPVPAPPSGAKLVQVHAIIRSPPTLFHRLTTVFAAGTVTGLRGREIPAGLATQPSGTVASTVPKYPCTPTPSMDPLSPDSTEKACLCIDLNVCNGFLVTVFGFGGEALNGNCSVGQLTTIGFDQQLPNGGSLKKAYVDTGFLSTVLSPSEIYLRSDSKCSMH